MANRPNNIWAKAAAGSPGTNIARAQQSRWTGIPNEAIMRLVEDKIGGMLEGISDATERSAAAQMQLDLQQKRHPLTPPRWKKGAHKRRGWLPEKATAYGEVVGASARTGDGALDGFEFVGGVDFKRVIADR